MILTFWCIFYRKCRGSIIKSVAKPCWNQTKAASEKFSNFLIVGISSKNVQFILQNCWGWTSREVIRRGANLESSSVYPVARNDVRGGQIIQQDGKVNVWLRIFWNKLEKLTYNIVWADWIFTVYASFSAIFSTGTIIQTILNEEIVNSNFLNKL